MDVEAKGTDWEREILKKDDPKSSTPQQREV